MKKKFALLLLSLLCLCACAIGLAACNTANGTYYLINREGKVEMNTYIKLDGKKWEDNEGFSGTYKIEDDKITFYMEVFGESAEWNSGSYKDGIIKISSYLGGKQTFVSENHKHSYGSWEQESDATCTEDGIETRTCACGIKESRSWQQAKGHKWGEWEIITDSTCSVEGSKTHQCSRCSITETETIGIKDHKFEGWDFDETKHFRNCIVGGEYYEETHIGNNICSVCQYKYGDTIGLKYALNSHKDGYTVIGLGEVNATEIKIPNVYKGLPVTSIGNSAFKNCSSLSSVTVPDNITSIGEEAFSGCSSLASINIPDSVTSIDRYAFDGCNKLIQNENGVHYVGKWVVGCDSDVTQVTLHLDTNVVKNAFSGCSSLESITVDENNPNFSSQDGILYNKAKTGFIHIPKAISGDITIADGITSISDSAFENRTALTSVSIPYSVTSIGYWAFSGCSSLTSITIPESVTSINSYAFDGCSSLQYNVYDNAYYLGNTDNPYVVLRDTKDSTINSCRISPKTKVICYNAFSGCSSLTSITIPNSVTCIGRYAFNYCYKLTIYCEVTSKPNDWDNYWNKSNCPVVWNCNNNDKDHDGYMYIEINGIRYKLKDNYATVVGQPNNIVTANIPATVTYKGTTYNVTKIGEYAFQDCTSLTSITIPDSVTYINIYAFEGCTSLTSITIPDSVTSIVNSAFKDCTSLTSITIPDSVTYINSFAFKGCTSLTSIKFEGTIDEWKAIKKDSEWNYNTGRYTIYCTDGQISKYGTVTKN